MTQDQTKLSLGIDFGGTTIKTAVVAGARIVERGNTFETQRYSAPQIIDLLVGEIGRLRGVHPTLRSVGIGLPGIIDHVGGVVHDLTNVNGWHEVPLRDILQAKTGMKVIIENDAKAMTYAEWQFGAAAGHQNVVCLTLGTGVGGGLILNGALYYGSRFGAGEIGQMSIDHRGIPGSYGNFGALEEYVGNLQITERACRRYAEAGRAVAPGDMTPSHLATAARAGDAIAIQLWQEIGTEVGVACANLAWLLNPDCIILGGGVANAGELIFDPVRRVLRERTMPVFYEKLQVLAAALGTDAGMIGCGAMSLL